MGQQQEAHQHHGDLVPTVPVTGRADLTDAQWAVLEPLPARQETRAAAEIPQAAADRRDPLAGPHRRAVAGRPRTIRALAVGVRLFRRWQRDGTWRQIVTALQARADAAGLITWDVPVDCTVARAHQHAAGARKRGTCRPNRPAGSRTSRRSRPGTVAGRADHQGASGLRAAAKAAVSAGHRGPAR